MVYDLLTLKAREAPHVNFSHHKASISFKQTKEKKTHGSHFNLVEQHLHLKSNLTRILIAFYLEGIEMIALLVSQSCEREQNNIKASGHKSRHLDGGQSLGITLGEITEGGRY